MPFFQNNSISVIFTGKIKNFKLKNNFYPWIISDKIHKYNDKKNHIHQHIFDELINKDNKAFEEFCINDDLDAKNLVDSSTNFKFDCNYFDIRKRISNIQVLIFNKIDFLLIINFNSFHKQFIKQTKNYWKLYLSIRQYFKFSNVKTILSTLIESDDIILKDSYGKDLSFSRFKIMSSITLECENEVCNSIKDINYILSCATDTNVFENIVPYEVNSISLYKDHYLSVSKEAICSLTVKKKNISFYKKGKDAKIYKDLKLAYYIYLLQYHYLFYFKREVMLSCDKKRVYLNNVNCLLEELIYFTTNYRYISISSFDYLDKAYTYILKENEFDKLLEDANKSVNPLSEYYNKKKKDHINIILACFTLFGAVYTTHNIIKCIYEDLNSLIIIIISLFIYLPILILLLMKKTKKIKILKKHLK